MQISTSEKLQLFLFLMLLFCGVSGREIPLRIIQTSDLHGKMESGQLARTAAVIEQEIRDAGGMEKSLRIDCGDLIQGSYPMLFPAGREMMIRFLNSMSYDVFVPGNHDFEFGSGALLSALRQFRGSVCALNLDWREAPVCAWKMIRRNGLNIAVIGIAYPSLPAMFPKQVLGRIRILSVSGEMKRIMPEIMRAKPEAIVLAVHAGEYTPLEPRCNLYDLIREYPQIDLVLSGHSHQQEAGKPLGRSSWRMQPPPLAGGIAVADLVYDDVQRRITSLKTRLVFTSPRTPEHPETARLLAPLLKRTERSAQTEIARLPFALRPLEKGEHSNPATRLFADAVRAHTGAQIVFFDSGSRYRKNPGILTPRHIYLLMPYDDHIETLELTGRECLAVLEEQLKNLRKNRAFLPPDGLEFRMNRGKIETVKLSGGGELDPDGLYLCAFSSFACSGGNSRWPELNRIVQNKKKHFYPEPVREILREYLVREYPVKKEK